MDPESTNSWEVLEEEYYGENWLKSNRLIMVNLHVETSGWEYLPNRSQGAPTKAAEESLPPRYVAISPSFSETLPLWALSLFPLWYN